METGTQESTAKGWPLKLWKWMGSSVSKSTVSDKAEGATNTSKVTVLIACHAHTSQLPALGQEGAQLLVTSNEPPHVTLSSETFSEIFLPYLGKWDSQHTGLFFPRPVEAKTLDYERNKEAFSVYSTLLIPSTISHYSCLAV